jgi:hypothetical protein
VKSLEWWSPENPSGVLLSSTYVQTFVVELPPLKESELETALRYKVQALLPVQADGFPFFTRFFKHGKKLYGAAFLSSESTQAELPASKAFRVGLPLTLSKNAGVKTLLFISTPAGLSAHYYEGQVLKTSFAPIANEDRPLRDRILAEYPDAKVISFDPDQRYPLPPELLEDKATEAQRETLMSLFPLWKEPSKRRWPLVVACLLAFLGLALCFYSLDREVTAREARNIAWKSWIRKAEVALTVKSQDQSDKLVKAQGAPLPELFERLAADWGEGTRIVDLEWTEGKLSITALSASALESLRKLMGDPWFHGIKIGGIKTQKDGSEEFTIEGGLNLDSK